MEKKRAVHPLSKQGEKALITVMFLLLFACIFTFLGARINSLATDANLDPTGLWVAFIACTSLYFAMAYYWYKDLHAGNLDMKLMVWFYVFMIGMFAAIYLLMILLML